MMSRIASIGLLTGILALIGACGGTTRGAGGGDGGGSGGGGSDGGCPGAGVVAPDCNEDVLVSCSGGATGFTCAAGADPETEDPTYSCSIAAMTCVDPCTCQVSFCCFVPTGPEGSCTSDNTLACPPGPDSYAYQCGGGADPATLDAALHCAPPTPDADGIHDDFCCTYLGSIPDGGPPTGCTLDGTLLCSGGANGYSCNAGDNPANEDLTLSCSTPQTDPTTGGDDFCCFSAPAGDFGSSTCVADDDLTTVCPDADSYGYQCVSGDDPSTLDSSLTGCSAPTPDADGVHDDFCCTYD